MKIDMKIAVHYGVDFSLALKLLQSGAKVQREGWNGKGMWLKLQKPCVKSEMSLPYIYMRTSCGNNVPWLASQTDLLSEDWRLYDEGEKDE